MAGKASSSMRRRLSGNFFSVDRRGGIKDAFISGMLRNYCFMVSAAPARGGKILVCLQSVYVQSILKVFRMDITLSNNNLNGL
jgi:hypothetical protein